VINIWGQLTNKSDKIMSAFFFGGFYDQSNIEMLYNLELKNKGTLVVTESVVLFPTQINDALY
jgi:hypothetical protein